VLVVDTSGSVTLLKNHSRCRSRNWPRYTILSEIKSLPVSPVSCQFGRSTDISPSPP
jgi:hypothetical protein